MEAFIDHIIFVCLSAVGIGTIFMLAAGILKVADYCTNNKISSAIVNFFNETSIDD